MSNHKAYKPLPSFEDHLLSNLPAYWREHGKSHGDPLDGQPHPDYKPSFPKGKCQACGGDYERKSNRQLYCPDCQPKMEAKRLAKVNTRRGIVRTLGSVPPRARAFVWDARALIRECKSRYGDRVRWDAITNERVVYRTGFGSHLSGEWEGVWSEGVFEDNSGRRIPKGIKPELAYERCECGGRLIIELPRGRHLGAKIGAKELVCSKCGLVVAKGVRSYPEEAVDDYRCSGSGQSW